jgi:hypothetical protein
MGLETLHRNIKYGYFKGKSVRRLDEAIYLICLFLKEREHDWAISYEKGKITKKHTAIFQNHITALKMKSDYSIEIINNNNVKVFNLKKTTSHIVTIDETCKSHEMCLLSCRYCDVCLERVSCTCIVNSIYFDFCKHCHFVLLSRSNQTNDCDASSNILSSENDNQTQLESSFILPNLNSESVQETEIFSDVSNVDPNYQRELDSIELAFKNLFSKFKLKHATISDLNKTKNFLLKEDKRLTLTNIANFESESTVNQKPRKRKLTHQIRFHSIKRKSK